MKIPAYRILVGIDFSSESPRVLREAVRVAGRVGGELDLLHVFPIPQPFGSRLRDELGDVKERLRGVRQREVPHDIPARIAIRLGDPLFGILDASRQSEVDLVVIGSHGHGAILRALMGSVSDAVARRSRIPVLLVPSERRAGAVVLTDEERLRLSPLPAALAWSCARCGHIRGALALDDECSACGANPATWDSAEIPAGPPDAMAPAVGTSVLESEVAATPGNAPSTLFATSPAGIEGHDVNPELRVRY